GKARTLVPCPWDARRGLDGALKRWRSFPPSCICSGRRLMRRCPLSKSISTVLSRKGCLGSILYMASAVGGCDRRLRHSWSTTHWYGVFRPAMPVAVRPLLNSKDKLVSQLIPEEVVQEVLLRTDIVEVIGD